MKLLNYTKKKLTNLVKFCRKFGQKTRLFSENLLKNIKKGQNFGIFLQNPVSGPHKRHDGGWNCLIIQQKNVKYRQIWSNIVENLVKNQAFFREIYSKISKKAFFQPKFWYFFLQNPVSGPLKRHDGGWKCLIIQKKLSNLVKFCG